MLDEHRLEQGRGKIVDAMSRSNVAESREAEALFAAACRLWSEGRRSEAVYRLDEALVLAPDSSQAICMGAYMLGEMGRFEPALRFYNRALELDPRLALAHSNAGKLLFKLARPSDALKAFDAAIELEPNNPDAWNGRAGALRELGSLEESLEAARHALALRPGFAEAAINIGNALLKLDRMEEALSAYCEAEEARPHFAHALCGQGLALRNLGRYDEAMAAFDAAEALGSREAIANKGCLLLTIGDFERGLSGYEARWLGGKSLSEALGARHPRWRGPGLGGDRVLVFNDHGLGDTFQFVRYLPLMAAANTEATFVCPAKLHRLLEPSLTCRLVDAPPDEPFDAQIALSSLPWAFGTRLDTIPAVVPYLNAEPKLREAWAERVGAAGFKVGIAWQGTPHPEADRARSFPLVCAAPVASLPGVRLISLQKGFGEEQIEALPQDMRVESLGTDFDMGPDAFVDTTAVISHLDLVVTCDTSIAHLAGSLARPVWVALKRDAEWRWMTDRDDSPWYPTMRLFRQPVRGAWREVFETMARALEAPLAARLPRAAIIAPCSIGDLIDRLTILRLKSERIPDERKRANVLAELGLLGARARDEGLVGGALEALAEELAEVNAELWQVEDALRVRERDGDFGARFIALARSVYVLNDRRAALKRSINDLFGSAVVEEKSYG
jgi:tetratricopeptide (TPR) repeat protein